MNCLLLFYISLIIFVTYHPSYLTVTVGLKSTCYHGGWYTANLIRMMWYCWSTKPLHRSTTEPIILVNQFPPCDYHESTPKKFKIFSIFIIISSISYQIITNFQTCEMVIPNISRTSLANRQRSLLAYTLSKYGGLQPSLIYALPRGPSWVLDEYQISFTEPKSFQVPVNP